MQRYLLSESFLTELVVEVDPEPISQEHADFAIKFGLQLNENPLDAKEYIVWFFKKLVLQREKIHEGLLHEQLKPDIEKLWQEVLTGLEDRSRRLVDVGQGSVTFTLFCPTGHALDQLMDETWIDMITQRLKQLLAILGMKLFNVVTQDNSLLN